MGIYIQRDTVGGSFTSIGKRVLIQADRFVEMLEIGALMAAWLVWSGGVLIVITLFAAIFIVSSLFEGPFIDAFTKNLYFLFILVGAGSVGVFLFPAVWLFFRKKRVARKGLLALLDEHPRFYPELCQAETAGMPVERVEDKHGITIKPGRTLYFIRKKKLQAL